VPKSSRWSHFFRFPHQNPACISLFLHICHMLCPSYPPWSDHLNTVVFGDKYNCNAPSWVSPSLSTWKCKQIRFPNHCVVLRMSDKKIQKPCNAQGNIHWQSPLELLCPTCLDNWSALCVPLIVTLSFNFKATIHYVTLIIWKVLMSAFTWWHCATFSCRHCMHVLVMTESDDV
jgi:hypothetical protein